VGKGGPDRVSRPLIRVNDQELCDLGQAAQNANVFGTPIATADDGYGDASSSTV
jgi:hypothetical protein